MNAISQWKFALAQKVGRYYTDYPRVKIVEVGGSVAQGRADRYSDVELGIFWEDAPSDEERRAIVDHAQGTLWHLFPYDPEAGNWTEDYYIGEVKFDVGHYTIGATEDVLTSVLEHYDISLTKQYLLSAIQHAIPFSGAPLLEKWQAKLAVYPQELVQAMVREHLQFSPCWGLEMLAERGDLLLLYDNFCSLSKKILFVLMAINHIYYPGFKWLEHLIEDFSIAPSKLSIRLKELLLGNPQTSVVELLQLIEETYAVVETHVPEFDIKESREWFRHRRPLTEHAPQGLL